MAALSVESAITRFTPHSIAAAITFSAPRMLASGMRAGISCIVRGRERIEVLHGIDLDIPEMRLCLVAAAEHPVAPGAPMERPDGVGGLSARDRVWDGPLDPSDTESEPAGAARYQWDKPTGSLGRRFLQPTSHLARPITSHQNGVMRQRITLTRPALLLVALLLLLTAGLGPVAADDAVPVPLAKATGPADPKIYGIEISDDDRAHWAFRPIAAVVPPVPERQADWIKNPIDAFIHAHPRAVLQKQPRKRNAVVGCSGGRGFRRRDAVS